MCFPSMADRGYGLATEDQAPTTQQQHAQPNGTHTGTKATVTATTTTTATATATATATTMKKAVPQEAGDQENKHKKRSRRRRTSAGDREIDADLRRWLDLHKLPDSVEHVLKKLGFVRFAQLRMVLETGGSSGLASIGGELSVWNLLRHSMRPLHIALFHDACRYTDWQNPLLPCLAAATAATKLAAETAKEVATRASSEASHDSSNGSTHDDKPAPQQSHKHVSFAAESSSSSSSSSADATDALSPSPILSARTAPAFHSGRGGDGGENASSAGSFRTQWCRKKQLSFEQPAPAEGTGARRRKRMMNGDDDNAPDAHAGSAEQQQGEEADFTAALEQIADPAVCEKLSSIRNNTCSAFVEYVFARRRESV